VNQIYTWNYDIDLSNNHFNPSLKIVVQVGTFPYLTLLKHATTKTPFGLKITWIRLTFGEGKQGIESTLEVDGISCNFSSLKAHEFDNSISFASLGNDSLILKRTNKESGKSKN
jgi:hypothetical protein